MTDQPEDRDDGEAADLLGLVQAIRRDARAAHERQVEASQHLGYIVQAADEFATHYETVAQQPYEVDIAKAIRSGITIGDTLRDRLGILRSKVDPAADAVASALPFFATAAAGAHTMGNSFSIPSGCQSFQPPPFGPESGVQEVVGKLTQLSISLAQVYRDAWGALYVHPVDPARAALWQLRHVFDQLFELLAPDDDVRRTEHWVRKEGPKPLQVYREERIHYAAHRWVTEPSLRSVLLESAQETLRAYSRLQRAHERNTLDHSVARGTFIAVDEIIRRWVNSIDPWPPSDGT